MARVTTTIDDLSGATLNEDVAATTISVDGTKYTVDLGESSKAHLLAWLSGEGPYNYKTATAAKAATKTSNTKASGINNYGFDPKEVRAWAIANAVPNGDKEDAKPVGNVGKLAQYVYDAYKEANNA